MSDKITKKRMCAKEAAAYVNLHYSTLAKYRISGDGPIFLKLGSKIIYEQHALDSWMSDNAHSSTSEYLPKNE